MIRNSKSNFLIRLIFFAFTFSSFAPLHSANLYRPPQMPMPPANLYAPQRMSRPSVAVPSVPSITLGVYMKAKDRYAQFYRAKLRRDKKYIIEAKCKVADFSKMGKHVKFRLNPKNGLEYFEINGVPAGNEIIVPWDYDFKTQSCTAKVTMSAVTMTMVFKTDFITASSEGVKEGKFEFEILPPQ